MGDLVGEERGFEELVLEVVKAHIGELLEDYVRDRELKLREISLMERLIRVEEELKALRELEAQRFEALYKEIDTRFEALYKEIDTRFEAMNTRFEALYKEMNSRFEALEKRFNFLQWFMGIGFSILIIILTILTVLVAMSKF